MKSLIEVEDKEASPHGWASSQGILGNAYRNRVKGDKKENMELAIAAYQAAMSVYTEKSFPNEWAGVQNNLGLAHLEKVWQCKFASMGFSPLQKALIAQAENTDKNLEEAANAFQNALRVFKDTNSEGWARVQLNLGLVYLESFSGNKINNLTLAVNSFESALRVFTREDYPQIWAMIHNDLGIAKCDLYVYRDSSISSRAISF